MREVFHLHYLDNKLYKQVKIYLKNTTLSLRHSKFKTSQFRTFEVVNLNFKRLNVTYIYI